MIHSIYLASDIYDKTFEDQAMRKNCWDIVTDLSIENEVLWLKNQLLQYALNRELYLRVGRPCGPWLQCKSIGHDRVVRMIKH